jgi:glutamyl-Q tRNA(Asp) synthetase
VGDFVLQRADGLFAYQLAVVVDDAAQGITHVVRGEDLATTPPARSCCNELLGLANTRYLHTPLVLGANGEKLSKQNGAQALDMPRRNGWRPGHNATRNPAAATATVAFLTQPN